MASASASHEIVNCVVMPKIQTAHILETVCKIADEIGGRVVGEERPTHTHLHDLGSFVVLQDVDGLISHQIAIKSGWLLLFSHRRHCFRE